MKTVDSAPVNRRILVWVRDARIVNRGEKSGAWIPGCASNFEGSPKKLHADGYNGDWDIPYWTDFPPNAE